MSSKKLPKVAYFCMEYALESPFKIYAGGVGILAGDYLKGVKDHGYPLVGIGIRWKQGYGEQMVDADTGKVYDAYKSGNHDFLEDTGVIVEVEIKAKPVKVKVWRVNSFGVDSLYLLDTDIEENDGEARWITGQLYGWFGEERVAQEMVLGIGGVRALQALRIKPDVYHFNEGHALFAGFELMHQRMAAGVTFEAAWGQDSRGGGLHHPHAHCPGQRVASHRPLHLHGRQSRIHQGPAQAARGQPLQT